MKQKIIGKLVVKFVFEVDNFKEQSFGDYEVLDFFIEHFQMKENLFDWKESEAAQKWIAAREKKGLVVKELEDGDDAAFLIALKPEYWPTTEYIATLLGDAISFIEPEME